MKVLFVVPYVPNKIRVRPYNWIRYLSRLGHQITLFTVCTNQEDHLALQELRKYCDEIQQVDLPAWRSLVNCTLALPTRQPLQSVYSWDASLADGLFALASQNSGSDAYDILHVEHLRGARYGLDFISRSGSTKHRLPVVWDSVDSISLLFRQAMVQSKSFINRSVTRFELGRTEEYEGWLVKQFDSVLVTSKHDQQALLDLAPDPGPEKQINVLPNGVDLEYFTPHVAGERQDRMVVLSGKMSYHANVTMVVDFIEKIMPQVWKHQPEVKVWIVGKDPPPRLSAYAENANINVTGTVDDIRPYLRKATISASPIPYGVGIQNKVLEAMACGTPVVASQQAVSALDIRADEEVMVASSPDEFAEKMLVLFDSAELRSEVGEAGRKYVERNHDWGTVAGQLSEIYSQTMARNFAGT
ncbi:MAG: glycosyltransferase [Anaerolineales bacterium]|jgi:sugar transferase (PEP-CTERM/EpsH1 system associated)